MVSERDTIRILSIDGGGIRGLIPAVVLAALQELVGATPLVDLFDVMTGTSTGGLIALGLVMPGANGKPLYTAEDMVRLYTEDGARIFSRSLWYRLTSLDGIRRPRYPAKGIEAVLKEKFGAVQLKDALKEVVVPSYDILHRKVRIFSRYMARSHADHDFLIRDVARATSAAPTYFSPTRIRNLGDGSEIIAVDGGVGANNPTLLAYVEAMKVYSGKNYLVASFGTGKAIHPFPTKEALDWGILGWAEPIVDVLFNAQASLVSEEMSLLVPFPPVGGSARLFRFQADLTAATEKLDGVAPANLAALRSAARDLIDARKDDLKQLCDLLLTAR